MNENYAALVGASVSALLMVLANRSSRRQGDIREIFSRLNNLEREVTRLEANKPRNWRGH